MARKAFLRLQIQRVNLRYFIDKLQMPLAECGCSDTHDRAFRVGSFVVLLYKFTGNSLAFTLPACGNILN
jgi:hypothetical protein